MIDRPDQRRDASGRLAPGRVPAERAAAARSVIAAGGFAIAPIDDLTWLVEGSYVFHPATGYWTGPGEIQGYGARALVEHLRRRAAKPTPEEPPAS